MEAISILFVVLSVVMLSYILNHIRTKKRIHNLIEVIFILIYFCFTIVLIFPKVLDFFAGLFGVGSGINFVIYVSVFLAYLFIYSLYGRVENQRLEITKLNREIALMRKGKEKFKEK